MSPSDLQETQQKVVPAGATQVTPIIVALLRRCFPQWLVRDILAPLAVSRVALLIVAWLRLHLLQVRLNGTKPEVVSNGYVQIVAEPLSLISHPFIITWARRAGGGYP